MFEEKASPQQQEGVDQLNTLMQLALPDINAGKALNIPDLARQAGVDETTTKEVLEAAVRKINELRNR